MNILRKFKSYFYNPEVTVVLDMIEANLNKALISPVRRGHRLSFDGYSISATSGMYDSSWFCRTNEKSCNLGFFDSVRIDKLISKAYGSGVEIEDRHVKCLSV